MNKREFVLGSLGAACLAVPKPSLTQSLSKSSDYPNKPIHLIVPSDAGGGTDYAARAVGSKLSDLLGQSIIVDDRPGAAGNIGVEQGARAEPDGYTLLMPITSFPMNPSLYLKLPFDTEKDFVPIVKVCSAPLVLVVNTDVKANTLQELIALAKKNPGMLNYANSGNGTSSHLAGELLKKMADAQIMSINYKGGGAAIVDTVAGRVQMYFSTVPAAFPNIQAGRLKALAVSSTKRVDMLPDVPTADEAGLPGFEVVGWFGIFAPKGTPEAITQKLNVAINTVLQRPDIRAHFAKEGLVTGGGSQEDLRKLLQTDMAKWNKLIKEIGIQPI